MTFPYLDLQFWYARMLNHIANMIGKPYYVDKLTSSKERLSYARILIEVNAVVTLKQCIWLKGPNGIKIEHKVF